MDAVERKACMLYFRHMYSQNERQITSSVLCTPFHTAIATGNTCAVEDFMAMLEVEDRLSAEAEGTGDTGDGEGVFSNSEKDYSKGKRDRSNNERDCSNSERDRSNNERDCSNSERDRSNNERDCRNSERDCRNNTLTQAEVCLPPEMDQQAGPRHQAKSTNPAGDTTENGQGSEHAVKITAGDIDDPVPQRMWYESPADPKTHIAQGHPQQPLTLTQFVLGSPISYAPSMVAEGAPLSREYTCPIQHELTADELAHLGVERVDGAGVVGVEGEAAGAQGLGVTLGFYKACVWDVLQFPSCLGLALASGDEKLLRLLLPACNVLQQDQRANSCAHYLVLLCEHSPHTAVSMYAQLCDLLPIELLRKLLGLRNQSGFTSLDLAADLCQPEILQVLMNTAGVYRHEVSTFGCKRFLLYDVTAYESKHAKVDNAILFKLTDMTEEQVIRAQQCKLLTSEPFLTWCQYKMNAQKLPLYLCFGYWVSFVLLFYSCVLAGDNGGAFAITLLAVFALLFWVIEIMFMKSSVKEMVRSYKLVVHQKRVPVTFTLVYRLLQMMFALGNLLMMFVASIENVAIVIVVSNCLTGVLSLLFFFQLNPSMGHMLMISQKMFADVLVFFLMVFLFFFGFSGSFYVLGVSEAAAAVSNGTAAAGAAGVVSRGVDWGWVSYSTFLWMMSIVSPADASFQHSLLPGLARVLFLVMVIVIGLVQLNMLIALMSSRLGEIQSCKHEVFWLEKLCIIMYIEQRINTRLGRWLFRKLSRCCRRRRGSMQQAVTGLVTHHHNIYLQVVERVTPLAQQATL